MLYIFIFLIIFGVFTIFKIIFKIIQQQRHIDDILLEKVTNGTIKDDPNYDRVIGHLGICERCRNRIDELIQGDDLINHLVE